MDRAPDPEELARQGIEMLDVERGVRAATTARTFFKPEEQVAFYGVRTRRVRQIESELFEPVQLKHSIHHGDTEYTEMHGELRCLCEISAPSVSPW